ncbi:MAG: hypothetical protein OJF50_006740 [Nitrospira sp.]|jgi:hypothetical protein|nr:hypothetical protein [Nitrospira sp.]
MEGGFLEGQSEGERYDLHTPHPPVFPLPSLLSPKLRESDSGKGAPPPTHPPTSSPIRTHPEPWSGFIGETFGSRRPILPDNNWSSRY